jgi:serine/threonine-protein kinase
MAEVYRAYDEQLNRAVAVKVLPPALATDADYVRRFRQEARRVAALRHPHIVPVYHYGEDQALLYLVMPIFSESLRDRLERDGRLAPEEAIRLVSEIASALEVAHAQELVHRDVKPENVLLDESDHALLTDFGIARRLSHARHGGAQTLSATGLPVGTPEYMAPEQLRGDTLDQRVDIYGLGAVLYETLTGQAPHEGETPYEVATLVLTTPVTPPAARNPHVWPTLDRAVLTALAQRPEDRFQTATSFAAALQEALSTRDQPSQPSLLASDHAKEDTPPEATSEEAPTLPAIPIARPPVRASARVAVDRALHSPRALVATLVTLLLVAALGGGALAGGFGLARGSRTIFMPGPIVTTTPRLDATTTTIALGTPTGQATTVPTPIATAAPRSPLTMTPALFALVPLPQDAHTCSATQIIINHTGRTLGWAWQKPAVGGFVFTINGRGQVNWPSNTSPGIAPGGHDTISVSSDCKPRSFAILMTDTLGNQYPFVVQVQ